MFGGSTGEAANFEPLAGMWAVDFFFMGRSWPAASFFQSMLRSQAQQDAQEASAGDERGGIDLSACKDCVPFKKAFVCQKIVAGSTATATDSKGDAAEMTSVASLTIRTFGQLRDF